MIASRVRRLPTRRGLTLMELIVVIAILVALAAILIPLFPGLIGRAETSGRATNHQEIMKAIQTFQASYTRYPEDWDALTDGSATPIPWLSGTGGANIGLSGSTPSLAMTQLTGPQTNALRASGITRLQLFATTAPAGTSLTFNPYADPSARDSATGALVLAANSTPNVVALTPLGQFQLGLTDNVTTSNGTYVVFGFGKRATIIGNGVAEAPVNFFDNAGLSPDTRYSRYGVVFQVSGKPLTQSQQSSNTNIIDFSKARLVRVVRFGGTLGTGDAAIQAYWDDVTTGGGS